MDTNPAHPFISPHSLAESDLLLFSFDLRTDGYGAGSVAKLVGWIVEEFSMKRCAYLASVLAARLGREHHVEIVRQDGRLAHAVTACAPQHGFELKGDCVDALGRRRLSETVRAVEALTGPCSVRTGEPLPPSDFEPGEAEALLDLSSGLPWMRSLMRLPRTRPDPASLFDAASRLGLPPSDATDQA